MSKTIAKASFGTAPVFLTAISTILGAIMFLRFGYAVGNVGFLGALGIILIGHLVTIPTAMAIAEISTNQKVEGGGEYFIISRSFGLNIGAAIGIALFLSQAISVAFYVIAFAEAFDPLLLWVEHEYSLVLYDKRIISGSAMIFLAILMLTKGADLGMIMLYIVVSTLAVSLVLFFLGNTGYIPSFSEFQMNHAVEQPVGFFYAFAICFPAFTGMTAGVGLSGDLKDPSKSIPLGTLAATLIGMVIYVFIALKLAYSASPEDLNSDQLIMSKIALWGPIIPIGLAAATFSSALGSIMVAPRTLQALAGDEIFPNQKVNGWLKKGRGIKGEPVNASLVVCAISAVFIAAGDVNAVAELISMFFMVTYGALCSISFLQHFAADPAYRPVFKSRWYLSLLGAVMCVWLMFKMNPGYAFGSLVFMGLMYLGISYYKKDERGVASIFKGVIYQISRRLQLFIQNAEKADAEEEWRPAIVSLSKDTFERYDSLEVLKWISHKYGFGTHLHLIEGYVSKATDKEAKKAISDLIVIANISHSRVFVDAIISPSYTSAVAQTLQLPGVSGQENNMFLFEYPRRDSQMLTPALENFNLVKTLNFDICILSSSDRKFGYMRKLHIWIGAGDYENANLMILLGYIILGHPDWKGGDIRIFALFPEDQLETQKNKLLDLVKSGRLPISSHNIELVTSINETSYRKIISDKSSTADLTIVGFRGEQVKHDGTKTFEGFTNMGNILFVNASSEKTIK